MVHDDDGRFLHLGNVARVRELALAALAGARAQGGAPADVMLDLEPPVDALRAASSRQLLPLVRTFTLGRRLAAPGEVAVHGSATSSRTPECPSRAPYHRRRFGTAPGARSVTRFAPAPRRVSPESTS
ncbi:MAG: hypothetical protein U0235_23145 [Polyangiaceae bacterium]